MPSPRKYTLNQEYFSSIDSPDKAYWLGFITADGSIYKTRYTNELCIRLSSADAEHVVTFAKHIGTDVPIKQSLNNHGRACVTIKISSPRIIADLGACGLTQNKTWTVTPWIGPSHLMPHYWRGVVDGDGWITVGENGKNKYFYTVGLCGNQIVVNRFRDYIHGSLGYDNSTIAKVLPSGKTFGQIAYTGTFRAKAICEHLLYGRDFVALPRKNGAAISIMSYAPTQKERNHGITNEQSVAILSDYRTGEYSQWELAEKYNVGKGTIHNIIKGKGRFAALATSP